MTAVNSYLQHTCLFRPDGGTGVLQELLRARQLERLLHHDGERGTVAGETTDGCPVGRRARPCRPVPSSGYDVLVAECAGCPARVFDSDVREAPACRAGITFPIDENTLLLIRITMERDAKEAKNDPSRLALVRSLVAAGDCDGTRLISLFRRHREPLCSVGLRPVTYRLDRRRVRITPYQLIEHIFFRPYLDPASVVEVRDWLLGLQAMGATIVLSAGVSMEEATDRLIAAAPSMSELEDFSILVDRAVRDDLGLIQEG